MRHFFFSQRMNQRYHFTFLKFKNWNIGLSMVLNVIKITTSRTKSRLSMISFRRLKKGEERKGERNLAFGAKYRKQRKQKKKQFMGLLLWGWWEEQGSLCIFLLVSSFLLWFKYFASGDTKVVLCCCALYLVSERRHLFLVPFYFNGCFLGNYANAHLLSHQFPTSLWMEKNVLPKCIYCSWINLAQNLMNHWPTWSLWAF